MAKRNKYEVVDFTRGGFFVHGGDLGETYFKHKSDADLVCDALNMMERLKLKKTQRTLESLRLEIDALQSAFSDGTESIY